MIQATSLALLALVTSGDPPTSPPPPEAAPAAARVFIDSRPVATVVLDGAIELGNTPIEVKLLSPGQHTFTFRRDGFDERVVTAEVTAGKRTVVDVWLQPDLLHGLPTLGMTAMIGYSAGRTSAVGREAGLGWARAHGITLGLSLQLFHLLDAQVDVGGWGPVDDATPPPLAEAPKGTRLNAEFAAASVGLTTPYLPIFRGRWIGARSDLMVSAAARLGAQAVNGERTRKDCEQCKVPDLAISLGAFQEVSVGLAWGLMQWPAYVGFGLRVAHRRFTSEQAAFGTALGVLLEVRANLPAYAYLQ